QGASLVRQHLAQRSRYRTAKWGHVTDAVRSQVKPLAGGDLQGRIYLGGRSAFVGSMLEFGTGPIGGTGRQRTIPKIHLREGRGGRRSLHRKDTILAFMMGGGLIFRSAVYKHPGTPAFHWREKAQAQLEPQVQGILDRALAEALSR